MWQTLKQRVWQWRGVLVAVPSMTVMVLGLRVLGLLQTLELAALDQFFLLRPRETIDPRIVIVEINEADVQKQGQWPMTDAVLAQLLEQIKQQQPSAIGLDLYRDLPVNPGHQRLLQLFQSTPNLIGVQKVVASADSAFVAPPPALKQRDQVGANDLPLDLDGKVRRMPLYLSDRNQQTVFSFGFELAARYLKKTGLQPELTPDGLIRLGSAVFPAFSPHDGSYVAAGAGGYQVILNYRGPIQSFHTVTMTDVLENRLPPTLLKERIVLIGATAESLKDLFYVPYSSSLTVPTRTAGVTIHANLISQILSAVLDGRPSIQTWNDWLEGLWIVFWTIVGAAVSWQQRYLKRPWNLISLIGALLAMGGLIGIAFLAFLQGWWIPVVPPLLGLAGATIVITGYVARSATDMRRTFGRYLSDEVVARLLETPTGLNLGGERRKVTILVADLRGFSAISERLPPEQVVTILNHYLGAMSDTVTYYHGTINEFMGDGIFVLFGAPVFREDDSERAIACAIAMQTAMESVNQQNQQMSFPALEMGIGINTGEVVVGNIGSQKRAKYTVIGSHVNLAARIESYTVGGQILISEHTFKDAGAIVQASGQMQVEPKGIREPITVYEVSGIDGKYNIHLPEAIEEFVTLQPPVPLCYTVLEGKHLVGTVFEGKLVRLSGNGAEMESDHSLMPLSNLKMTLLLPDQTQPVQDLYAKVLDKPAEHPEGVRIRFTGVVPEVTAVLDRLRQQHLGDPL